MSINFGWEKFADDLELLLNHKISENEILDKYEHAHQSGKDIDYILCNLSHFLSDGDIRKKDSEYRDMQEQEIKKLINLIRKGDIQKAKKIDFLHDSREHELKGHKRRHKEKVLQRQNQAGRGLKC